MDRRLPALGAWTVGLPRGSSWHGTRDPPPMRLDTGQIEVLDEAMADVLRRKEPWERIAIGFNLWQGAWDMLTHYLGACHPDWTEERIRQEVVRRMSHGAV